MRFSAERGWEISLTGNDFKQVTSDIKYNLDPDLSNFINIINYLKQQNNNWVEGVNYIYDFYIQNRQISGSSNLEYESGTVYVKTLSKDALEINARGALKETKAINKFGSFGVDEVEKVSRIIMYKNHYEDTLYFRYDLETKWEVAQDETLPFIPVSDLKESTIVSLGLFGRLVRDIIANNNWKSGMQILFNSYQNNKEIPLGDTLKYKNNRGEYENSGNNLYLFEANAKGNLP